jgi:hypothetical protein
MRRGERLSQLLAAGHDFVSWKNSLEIMNETSGELPPSESQSGSLRGEEQTIIMVGRPQLVSLFAGALNRPELRFSEVLVPWIMIVGGLGLLLAWLVLAIMEHTGLSRYVWHLPLFFVGLVVLFSSLIGMAVFP